MSHGNREVEKLPQFEFIFEARCQAPIGDLRIRWHEAALSFSLFMLFIGCDLTYSATGLFFSVEAIFAALFFSQSVNSSLSASVRDPHDAKREEAKCLREGISQ